MRALLVLVVIILAAHKSITVSTDSASQSAETTHSSSGSGSHESHSHPHSHSLSHSTSQESHSQSHSICACPTLVRYVDARGVILPYPGSATGILVHQDFAATLDAVSALASAPDITVLVTSSLKYPGDFPLHASGFGVDFCVVEVGMPGKCTREECLASLYRDVQRGLPANQSYFPHTHAFLANLISQSGGAFVYAPLWTPNSNATGNTTAVPFVNHLHALPPPSFDEDSVVAQLHCLCSGKGCYQLLSGPSDLSAIASNASDVCAGEQITFAVQSNVTNWDEWLSELSDILSVDDDFEPNNGGETTWDAHLTTFIVPMSVNASATLVNLFRRHSASLAALGVVDLYAGNATSCRNGFSGPGYQGCDSLMPSGTICALQCADGYLQSGTPTVSCSSGVIGAVTDGSCRAETRLQIYWARCISSYVCPLVGSVSAAVLLILLAFLSRFIYRRKCKTPKRRSYFPPLTAAADNGSFRWASVERIPSAGAHAHLDNNKIQML